MDKLSYVLVGWRNLRDNVIVVDESKETVSVMLGNVIREFSFADSWLAVGINSADWRL
jgi:hypothetical protein